MVGIVNLLGKKLSYLSAKTNVLSQNISKAEIPGYQRRDIKPFQEVLKNQRGHHGGLVFKGNDMIETNHEIIPEYEVNKMNDVYIEHQMTINHIKTMYSMMDTVMGTKN